jgi:guanylate kinase
MDQPVAPFPSLDGRGKAVIFSAPSGSGKTSIVRHLLERTNLPLGFSVSATTRPPRGAEREGVDYYFLDLATFRKQVEAGAFLEWEEVYPGKCYGTLRAELDRLWAQGKSVLFDVDVVGGLRLKELLGDRACAVFVVPPPLEELRRRLERRGTDAPEVIEERLAKATRERAYGPQFDVQLVNEALEVACAEAERIVREFLQSKSPEPRP